MLSSHIPSSCLFGTIFTMSLLMIVVNTYVFDQGLYFLVIFTVFDIFFVHFSLLCKRGRGRAARRGRRPPELLGHANARSSFCCTCVCSSAEYNSCGTVFLQCSSLERASRSLAKTGLFLVFFCYFFCVCFLFVFLEALLS